MKPVMFFLAGFSALSLTACDQIRLPGGDDAGEVSVTEASVPETDTAPAQVPDTEPTSPRKTAEIDWASARADFAARPESDESGLASVASGSNPPVPVLLPDMGVSAASGTSGLQFRPTPDGYFAVLPGEAYDLIINGSDKLVAVDGADAVPPSELVFEETLTGAQVSFSRYGASYLAEFMCKDEATALKGSCIGESDAKAIVQELLIAGTR